MHYENDKRLILGFTDFAWTERKSIPKWEYCKYCYEDAPCFVMTQGFIGDSRPFERMLCCWQCGSGLEMLWQRDREDEKLAGGK